MLGRYEVKSINSFPSNYISKYCTAAEECSRPTSIEEVKLDSIRTVDGENHLSRQRKG
jgi:hypothetical protein